jgi:hypothetical protein
VNSKIRTIPNETMRSVITGCIIKIMRIGGILSVILPMIGPNKRNGRKRKKTSIPAAEGLSNLSTTNQDRTVMSIKRIK